MSKEYDVIVIGAGPAGMTAALYASRSNLKVLMLDSGIYGGQMNNTDVIENYPGYKSITGAELSKKMYEGTIQFGVDYAYGAVQKLVDKGRNKSVHLDNGTEYISKVVIIATGSHYKKLYVPGEEEFSGRGVSYCAICDGPFFKDMHVAVVGGGDSALEEAVYLTNIVKKVTIIHRRDEFRAQKIIQQRVFDNNKIEIKWHSELTEITGDSQVQGVNIINNKTQEISSLNFNGVFIYVGIQPMTEVFKDLDILDSEGWVLSDDQMQTIVPGILVSGDVRKKSLRQITTAVGEGAIAGQQAYQYLQHL